MQRVLQDSVTIYYIPLSGYPLARNGEGKLAIYKDALLPGIGDGSKIQRSHVVTCYQSLSLSDIHWPSDFAHFLGKVESAS